MAWLKTPARSTGTASSELMPVTSRTTSEIMKAAGKRAPVNTAMEQPTDRARGDAGEYEIYGQISKRPFTYLRITTDDFAGKIRAYTGEGQFTDDPLNTFGGYGVVQVPRCQELLAHICENGYEHHVSINQALTGQIINEAFNKYLGWATYYHS